MNLQPPDHLDDRACEEWFRVLPELQRTGWFNLVLDQVILEGYCVMVSYAVAAEKLLAERGLVYTAPDGTESVNPIAEWVIEARNEALNSANVLGLTPKSRAEIERGVVEGEEWHG